MAWPAPDVFRASCPPLAVQYCAAMRGRLGVLKRPMPRVPEKQANRRALISKCVLVKQDRARAPPGSTWSLFRVARVLGRTLRNRPRTSDLPFVGLGGLTKHPCSPVSDHLAFHDIAGPSLRLPVLMPKWSNSALSFSHLLFSCVYHGICARLSLLLLSGTVLSPPSRSMCGEKSST